MWQVTTLLNSIDEVQAQPQRTEADLTALREQLTAQGETVKLAKAVSSLSCFNSVQSRTIQDDAVDFPFAIYLSCWTNGGYCY